MNREAIAESIVRAMTAALRAVTKGNVNRYSTADLGKVVERVFTGHGVPEMLRGQFFDALFKELRFPSNTGQYKDAHYQAVDYLKMKLNDLQHEGGFIMQRMPPYTVVWYATNVTAAVREATRELFAGKDRPETLFERYFFDMRAKAKDIKDDWAEEGKQQLQKSVFDDLAAKNVEVVSGELKLGKYKGSKFVTSFKLKVKAPTEKDAEALAGYLRSKYSPKWKLKSFADGVADYNVR